MDYKAIMNDMPNYKPEICNSCDLPTPSDELREYNADVYFCEICFDAYTMNDKEYKTKKEVIK